MVTIIRELVDVDKEYLNNCNSHKAGDDYAPEAQVELMFTEKYGEFSTLDQWLGIFKATLRAVGFSDVVVDRLVVE